MASLSGVPRVLQNYEPVVDVFCHTVKCMLSMVAGTHSSKSISADDCWSVNGDWCLMHWVPR